MVGSFVSASQSVFRVLCADCTESPRWLHNFFHGKQADCDSRANWSKRESQTKTRQGLTSRPPRLQ